MAAAIPPKVSRIVDILVSMAAAVVIIGALFKIEHWPAADEMLIVGLGTEAVVFLIYAFFTWYIHRLMIWKFTFPKNYNLLYLPAIPL